MLACGADMKGAFAIGRESEAYLFDGFGDLSDIDNFERYEKAIRQAEKKLKIKPRIVACDLHQGYFSTRLAEKLAQCGRRRRLYATQHHEAHIAGAIVDNKIKGDVIGVAFDGTGFGLDGKIWGGEFFYGNLNNMRRAGHIDYIPMPGADAAVKEPWRMAASYLYKAFGERFTDLKIDLVKKIDKDKWRILKKMVDKNINSILTSSAGRLFDAVGSMVFSRLDSAFEAELPIKLERAAADDCAECYNFGIKSSGGDLIIDPLPVIKGVVKDVSKNSDIPLTAAKFHNTIAEMIMKVSVKLSKKFKTRRVVLSGGVFQNNYLLTKTLQMLDGHFEVYVNLKTSVNDSGIPIGQIAIANARAKCA